MPTDISYNYCYPWKPEHDPLGQDTPWFDDGHTVLIYLGSVNAVDVHTETRKMNADYDPVEEDRLYYERRGKTPPDPIRKKQENEDIGIDTSKYFGVDGMRRFLKEFMD